MGWGPQRGILGASAPQDLDNAAQSLVPGSAAKLLATWAAALSAAPPPLGLSGQGAANAARSFGTALGRFQALLGAVPAEAAAGENAPP